jgi:hypothetical protein
MRSTVHRLIPVAVLIVAIFELSGTAVQSQSGLPQLGQPGPRTSQGNDTSIPPDMRKNMEKKANQQRQAELKRDTERLVKLSTELKQYVDKTNENILSLDVIKKADEIEKLARSVKTKMRAEQFGANPDIP